MNLLSNAVTHPFLWTPCLDFEDQEGNAIYNIEGHFQLFPLQQPCVIATNSNIWHCEDNMTTYLLQSPKDDLL